MNHEKHSINLTPFSLTLWTLSGALLKGTIICDATMAATLHQSTCTTISAQGHDVGARIPKAWTPSWQIVVGRLQFLASLWYHDTCRFHPWHSTVSPACHVLLLFHSCAALFERASPSSPLSLSVRCLSMLAGCSLDASPSGDHTHRIPGKWDTSSTSIGAAPLSCSSAWTSMRKTAARSWFSRKAWNMPSVKERPPGLLLAWKTAVAGCLI